MHLMDMLRERAGLPLLGVADAVSYGKQAPAGHRPADHLKGARSIVIIGTRMLDTSLDGLPETRQEYTANFHVANANLNEALFDVARALEEEGHRALPVPYKEMPGWNLEKRSAVLLTAMPPLLVLSPVKGKANAMLWDKLSYRHAAVAAGLGELGVNNLLLHPEHGPRVRFVAIITDAELPAGEPLEPRLCRPDLCGYACVRACPAGALFEDGRPTDKAACLRYYLKLGIPGQSGVRCGLCVAKCPANKPAFRKRTA